VIRLVQKIVLYIFLSQLVAIIVLRFVNTPITLTQISSLIEGRGFNRKHVSMEEIAVDAKLAVIAAEDQVFPDHSGFDFKSIEKAFQYNKRKPGRIRGASTISQQVAKNVFLWQGRSWFRKGLEVYFTFMIELIWSKERILEVYLNEAEMGRGIFGIEAAAKQYFNKAASRLSKKEAAMIAASLPNPLRFTVKPLSPYVSRRYPWIMRQMSQLQTDPDIRRIIGN
jgi:monofunctional glycosyltransferase